MGVLKGLRARLRALAHSRSADRELSEEIRFHIELETEKNRRAGMPPDEARRVALAHFGGVQRVREEHHDVRRLQWVEDFAGDMRFALRSLRRTPGLALAAIVTLALGIGANVAIFSAVNAVVLQPLPVPQPDRLVMVWEENPEKGWHQNVAAPANYLDWRTQVPAFQDAAAYASWLSHPVLTGYGDTRLLSGASVTGNFFTMLGIKPILGRGLRDEDTWIRPNPTVISYRAWRDVFGGDSSIVGKTIRIDGREVPVVGVMPPGIDFPWEKVDLWMSIGWKPALRADVSFRRAHWLRVIAKLKPGITAAAGRRATPNGRRATETPISRDESRHGCRAHAASSISSSATPGCHCSCCSGRSRCCCSSPARMSGSLLLVQAAAREREGAVRLALGAGTFRLVRQALAESLVLSLAGGACGLLLGWAGTHVLEGMQPPDMLRVTHFSVDRTVLLFVTLISCASGMLFAVAPALRARRRDPADALSGGVTWRHAGTTRTPLGRRARRLRSCDRAHADDRRGTAGAKSLAAATGGAGIRSERRDRRADQPE